MVNQNKDKSKLIPRQFVTFNKKEILMKYSKIHDKFLYEYYPGGLNELAELY